MEQETLVRPSPKAFILRHYAWAVALSLLLLLSGLYVLFGSSGPDILLPLGSIPVMQVVLGLWSVAVILMGIALIHTHLHQRVYLALRNEELVHEFGIFNRHHVTVPLNRITDSLIYASWFDRILGVATLKVNTAGGKEFEIIATDFPNQGVKLIHAELNKLLRKMPDSLPDELAKESGSHGRQARK